MKKTSSIGLMLLVWLFQVHPQTANNDYLGMIPPGNTPVIFAPGIISTTGYNEHTLSVSPDGDEIYFTRDPGKNTLIVKRNNTTWSNPASACFTGREALFSPNGSKLFFNDGDIWYVENSGTNWSSPTKLDTAINTIAHEYYASVSNDGTLYFSRIDTDNAHIYESKLENGHYASAKRLPLYINQNSCNNYHSFVSPGGDFILFNSNRAGGFGGADIYICFKKVNGDWCEAVNLGSEINSTLYDLCPVLSPDGKYIFFTRYDSENGEGDIYWVSSSIIDSLKKTANTTTLNIIKEQNIRINPNPSYGHITISFEKFPIGEESVQICNLQGTQVFSKTFQNTPSATIDLTSNPKGMYMVKVIADGASYEEKIVKE